MHRLVVQNGGGLCSRLMTIAMGLSIAERTGRRFGCCWARTVHCHCWYDDLFEPSSEFDLYRSCEEVGLQRQPFATETESGTRWIDLLGEQLGDLFIHAPGRLLGQRRADHRKLIEDELSARFLAAFRPKSRFLDLAEAYVANSFSGPTAGVHVRRGDYKKGMVALERFVAEVERLAADGRQIYLATDDGAPLPGQAEGTEAEGVVSTFQGRCPGRVLFRPPRSLARDSLTAIEDALIDIIILRQCEAFIGTASSSFSLAAILGRNVIQVLLPG